SPTTISIQANDPTASEAGSETGLITITRDGDLTAGLTVLYSVTGTAVNGLDYTGFYAGPNSAVHIPEGASSVSLAVTPVDDSEVEGSETVVVTLLSDYHYTLGSPRSATVTIEDNDKPAITISSISPTSGLVDGGSLLVIIGEGFKAGATVHIGNTLASITSITVNQIKVLAPPGPGAGTYDVVVTNPDGASATLPNGFSYLL